MKSALLALLLTTAAQAQAMCYSGDRWTTGDKGAHAKAGAVIALGARQVLDKPVQIAGIDVSPDVQALAVVAAVGGAKELIDCTRQGADGSTKDEIANLVGGAVALAVRYAGVTAWQWFRNWQIRPQMHNERIDGWFAVYRVEVK